MKLTFPKLPWSLVGLVSVVVMVVAASATYSAWWPGLSKWIDETLISHRSNPSAEEDHAHGGMPITAEATSLTVTKQSLSNLGLTQEYLKPIELSTYSRFITVPALVVPRPGRSQVVVASPLNGIVTHVHAVSGEAVLPGQLLFEIRLTYEDLVETQTLYLKTISELEVENREIVRLEEATQSGAISGKSLLERRYAKEKLEAHLRSLSEALRLHGLSDRQVEAIGRHGSLLRDLQVVAPHIDNHGEDEELRLSQNPYRPISHSNPGALVLPESEELKPLVIEALQVHKGQAVVAGEELCSLSDYTQLFVEGKAFEQDVPVIAQAAQQGWKVDAVFPGESGTTKATGLKMAFVGNSIDPDSRTLSFFVELTNRVLTDETNSEGQRYLSWSYRVGQRLELRVPVERWENQIVVPVDAVVKEGADWYVFQQNGNKFTRVPVHVKHRDQSSAVIANDGSVFPGDVIALKSAHQMQMAIKNSSGGGVDPHAGHNH